MNDPVFQVWIVGLTANVAGAGIAFYLWNERRSERFLMFWGMAWTAGLLRWVVHYPAESMPLLRAVEGLLIPTTMSFMVLGSYDLLPNKPWRHATVVAATATTMLAYGVAAVTVGLPIEMGYALFACVLAFSGACVLVAYRSTRLSGFIFVAGTCIYQLTVVSVLLLENGRAVANSIVVPLYNIPLMLGVVVIAFQRRGRELAESEHTLQQIFDTAPAPIIILRPPVGEIERANAEAFRMLGVSPEALIGKTAVDVGIVPDPVVRTPIYERLGAGERVVGQELTIMRAGLEARTVSVNANRLALDSGERFIFSFYDLTDLRRAEEQMRQLYVRLAKVEDEERRALQVELHDQVGANLAALRLELDIVANLLAHDDGVAAQKHLTSAREVAIETMAVARGLMSDLRPPALDDYGLVAALRALAESQSTRLNLPIHVSGADLLPRPGSVVEGQLFRIAHEAVMNAARHASATRVTMTVVMRDGRVMMTIEDDGVGFDAGAAGEGGPDHWGLKNMRERAQSIGATLEVVTTKGTGTRITATAPLEAV